MSGRHWESSAVSHNPRSCENPNSPDPTEVYNFHSLTFFSMSYCQNPQNPTDLPIITKLVSSKGEDTVLVELFDLWSWLLN